MSELHEPEIAAIYAAYRALEPLDTEARWRAIDTLSLRFASEAAHAPEGSAKGRER